MIKIRVFRPVTVTALMLGASACAVMPHQSHWVRTTPVTTPSNLSPVDVDYAAAAAAINRRDYGLALDYLQTARAHKADDVRVLNAFGVVYDKLGRFDLSARYYAQAKALDQNSSIVANNIAYSAALQRQAGGAPSLTAQTVAAPAPRLADAAVRPAILHVDLSSAKPPVLVLAKATPHRLVVIDASGRQGGAEPVRLALAQRGWSTPKTAAIATASSLRTTIIYPETSKPTAMALARTLPARAQLVACQQSCTSLRLVVGADAAGWRIAQQSTPKQRRG